MISKLSKIFEGEADPKQELEDTINSFKDEVIAKVTNN